MEEETETSDTYTCNENSTCTQPEVILVEICIYLSCVNINYVCIVTLIFNFNFFNLKKKRNIYMMEQTQ